MIEHLRAQVANVPAPLARWNLCREYLQAKILESLQRTGAFRAWAFCGGTALRFLFGIPRFSEDLDFSLADAEANPPFSEVVATVKRRLEAEGYPIEARLDHRRVVHAAMFGFPGLPFLVGADRDPRKKISIRVEIDTRPPPGAGLATTLVRRHIVVHLAHHDRPTLLAGKLHATLTRAYVKGRDLYDLAWYLSNRTWPAPNLPFLRAALQQTGWTGRLPTPLTWKRVVLSRLKDIDWSAVRTDVEPFLERAQDLEWLTAESLLPLLRP